MSTRPEFTPVEGPLPLQFPTFAKPLREDQWATSDDPNAMFDLLLKREASWRKIMWWACACVRRIWSRLQTERIRRAVEVVEEHADGQGKAHDLHQVIPGRKGMRKGDQRANQAVVTTPFLLMGAMSPVSIPATLVQQMAEALSGIALTQLVQPLQILVGRFVLHLAQIAPAMTTARLASSISAFRAAGGEARRPPANMPRRSSQSRNSGAGLNPRRLRTPAASWKLVDW